MAKKRVPVRIVTKRSEADVLRHRLDDGYQRIEDARQAGIDTQTWETFWVNLLHEYESICDELAEAA